MINGSLLPAMVQKGTDTNPKDTLKNIKRYIKNVYREM